MINSTDQKLQLRSWLFHFLELDVSDQKKFQQMLSENELSIFNQAMNDLSELNLDHELLELSNIQLNNRIIDSDKFDMLLNHLINNVPASWYALVDNPIFNNDSLLKYAVYYENYLRYKNLSSNITLAPNLRLCLSDFLKQRIFDV